MCGIFGAWRCPKAAEMIYYGLHSVQHRATEFAGIVTSDGTNLFRQVGKGIVQDVFPNQNSLDMLHGWTGIGHIRYSTVTDDPKLDNTQPVVGVFGNREVALAHNGNLLNHQKLRDELAVHGPFKTSMDTEVILRLFCTASEPDIAKRVWAALRSVRGTYSLLFLFDDVLVAVRDPWGNRPLMLGRRGDSHFVASETVAFDNLDIAFEREIAPGEILVISKGGLQSWYFNEHEFGREPLPHPRAQCIFELLYYGHPAGTMFGQSVVDFQIRAGETLCRLCPSQSPTVVPIPDSGLFHAEGYARILPGGKLVRAILRHHYIGRTFIEPLQNLRLLKVVKKFTAVAKLLFNELVTLIDDSIVRLTTLPDIVRIVRRAGARKVEARISTPPIRFPCFYGIDTPDQKELKAAQATVEEIRVEAGLDSLAFMPMEGLRSLVPNPNDFCYACMTGEYPIEEQ